MRIVANRITVDFEELKGSPAEKVSYDFWTGTGATRVLRCASNVRLKLIQEFLGYWQGSIYHEPHRYTDIDPTGLLVATDATTAPVGKIEAGSDRRFANYPKTDVTITYSIPSETFEAFGGLVTISETMRDASEFLTSSTKGLYWYVDGVTNELITDFDAPSKVNNLLEWTYEIRGIIRLPAGVWGYPGSVNDADCYSVTFDRVFPAETLLCMSPEVIRERNFNRITYTARLRFLAKNNGTLVTPYGWNHFPRRSITTDIVVSYERMIRAINAPNTLGGWKVFYPLEDFSTIFVP